MKKYDAPAKKKSCSVFGVVLFLIVIFALLIGGVFYLKTKIKTLRISNPLTSESVDQSLQKQLDNQAGEKEVSLRITEEDLATALNADSSDFPLKNPTVKINPDKVVITGKTSDSPLSFKLEVGITPAVVNGKVVFNISGIKTAGVSAPKVITDKVNAELGSYLNNSSSSLAKDIDVKDIKLNDGFLVVTGTRK